MIFSKYAIGTIVLATSLPMTVCATAHADVVSPAIPSNCSVEYTTDSGGTNVGSAATCTDGTGTFRAKAGCIDGDGNHYTAYGAWKSPGWFVTSWADCTATDTSGAATSKSVQLQ